jgi:hypothetical protein
MLTIIPSVSTYGDLSMGSFPFLLQYWLDQNENVAHVRMAYNHRYRMDLPWKVGSGACSILLLVPGMDVDSASLSDGRLVHYRIYKGT